MILKLTYRYEDVPQEIEITCSNYTFGMPKLFYLFSKKHNAGLHTLRKHGVVTDVIIHSYYNEKWHTVTSAELRLK